MIKSGISLVNDENKIRDKILIDYLKNNDIRNSIGLTDWHFEREVQEDLTLGRTDIKIISPNTFQIQEAYYILECKRIDNKNIKGSSGLNGEYIKAGIKRFTSNFYSSYYRVNCMIGFVVEKQDIDSNIVEINNLLLNHFSKSIVTHKELIKKSIHSDFKYSYKSKHSDSNHEKLNIYHLMFNFSNNIAA